MSKTNFQFLVCRQSSNCLCRSRCHSLPQKHSVFPLGRLSERDFYLLLTADMILTIFIFIVDLGSRFLCMLARTNKHFTERRASQTTSDSTHFSPFGSLSCRPPSNKGCFASILEVGPDIDGYRRNH